MAYILNEEGKQWVQKVKDFCDKEVKEQCKAYDLSGEFPWEIIHKIQDLKLNLIDIPKEYGGLGVDHMTAAAMYEQFAYADAGLVTTLTGTTLALKPILIDGTPEQIEMFSEALQAGKQAAFALTEADSGSDASKTKTVAVRDGDDYIINGTKCFITNAGVADIFVVFAVTDPDAPGTKGISAFIVTRDMGVKTGKLDDKMGIRTTNSGEVIFENVRVPAKNMVGAPGTGFKLAMKTLDLGRPFNAVGAVGIAQRALDEAVAFAKQRVTFGKPIIQHQGLNFLLADMDIKVETARQMVAHVFTLADMGLPYSREAAIAKCYASDICMQVTTDAVQVVGGSGYMRNYPVEKLMRDAKIYQIFEGTNQVQRIVIGGKLMK